MPDDSNELHIKLDFTKKSNKQFVKRLASMDNVLTLQPKRAAGDCSTAVERMPQEQ